MTYKSIQQYIFIVFMGLALLTVTIGFIYLVFSFILGLFEYDISHINSFWGAVIVGSLTFIGVLLTLHVRGKNKKIRDLPNKLMSLQIIMDKLDRFINDQLLSSSEDSNNVEWEYIKLNNAFALEFNDKHKRITRDFPSELKKELIFIDAEMFGLCLNLESDLWKLDEHFNEIQTKLNQFKGNKGLEINMKNGGNGYLSTQEDNNKLRLSEKLSYFNNKEITEIKNVIDQSEQRYKSQLKKIYEQFHLSIIAKHDDLSGQLVENHKVMKL